MPRFAKITEHRVAHDDRLVIKSALFLGSDIAWSTARDMHAPNLLPLQQSLIHEYRVYYRLRLRGYTPLWFIQIMPTTTLRKFRLICYLSTIYVSCKFWISMFPVTYLASFI